MPAIWDRNTMCQAFAEPSGDCLNERTHGVLCFEHAKVHALRLIDEAAELDRQATELRCEALTVIGGDELARLVRERGGK